MIRHLIVTLILFALIVFGIGYYLQLDDMKECDDRPSDKSGCKIVDTIVVISGGDTNARVDEAINLYKKGWSAKLIFSGAAKDKSGPSNAAAMKSRAIADGVPELAIILDEFSESTKQNAVNAQVLFEENSIKSVILVTSPYHQRRASLEFEKHTIVGIINHPVQSDSDWSTLWWLTPRGWWLAGGEMIKIISFYAIGA